MSHELRVAESRSKSIQDDFWFARSGHGGSEFADCEDLKEFGDVVTVGLVFGGF